MVKKTVSYAITVTESAVETGWVRVTMRKMWWIAGKGTSSRPVIETWLYRGDMPERDAIGAALRDLLRTYEDRMG